MHRIPKRCAEAASLLLVLSFALVLACANPPIAACRTGICGNGCVTPPEQCDDDLPDCLNCRFGSCGNGFHEIGEGCDDFNNNNEDACRNDCTEPECVVDADCSGPSEICLSTYCLPGCRTNADCAAAPPPGEVCDVNTCVPRPTTDADCRRDQVLDATTGTCVTGCRTDFNCQAVSGFVDRICAKGIAQLNQTSTPCSCASDCTGSQICWGVCLNIVAYDPIGTCRQGCRNASQCDPGEDCNAYGECAGPCTTNADCCSFDSGNSGDTCETGACLDNCTSNADCGRGAICNGSLCATGCASDADCDAGLLCDAGTCGTPAPTGCGTGSKCVFMTAATFAPSFNGSFGADVRCQNAANAGSSGVQGRTFKAWISDSASSPSTRFTQAAVPYKLLDGTTIASNWSDLTDGVLTAAIGLDEHGMPRTGPVWTNTLPSGTANNGSANLGADSCVMWGNPGAPSAWIGTGGALTNSTWTNSGQASCATTSALYCFEQ
jgi:hypothetical protein